MNGVLNRVYWNTNTGDNFPGNPNAAPICLKAPAIARQPQIVTAGTAEPIRIYNLESLSLDTVDVGGDSVRGGVVNWDVFEANHPWPGETDPDARRARIAGVACSDLDGDGIDELIVHRVARSSGSCTLRCADVGRFAVESMTPPDAKN